MFARMFWPNSPILEQAGKVPQIEDIINAIQFEETSFHNLIKSRI
jgi:hypothetical protein